MTLLCQKFCSRELLEVQGAAIGPGLRDSMDNTELDEEEEEEE